jgi:hypothetical protein
VFQETATTEELTENDVSQHVAVGGDPADPVNVALIVEQIIVVEDFTSFAHGVCHLFGLHYAFNMKYPACAKYTYEFVQKVIFKLGDKYSHKLLVLQRQLSQLD